MWAYLQETTYLCNVLQNLKTYPQTVHAQAIICKEGRLFHHQSR